MMAIYSEWAILWSVTVYQICGMHFVLMAMTLDELSWNSLLIA